MDEDASENPIGWRGLNLVLRVGIFVMCQAFCWFLFLPSMRSQVLPPTPAFNQLEFVQGRFIDNPSGRASYLTFQTGDTRLRLRCDLYMRGAAWICLGQTTPPELATLLVNIRYWKPKGFDPVAMDVRSANGKIYLNYANQVRRVGIDRVELAQGLGVFGAASATILGTFLFMAVLGIHRRTIRRRIIIRAEKRLLLGTSRPPPSPRT